MHNDVYAFIIFILNGFLIGLFFDFFRILRKGFKTPDFITYFEDFIFWIITGFILLYSIFKFNNGELRLYIFLGIFIGITIYMLVFSKLLISISVCLINIIKKTIIILIVKPIILTIRFIKKILYKPIILIYNILKKIMSFFNLKLKMKKDFT